MLLCVFEFPGLDRHTLLLIKRTSRQSGVSATPGGNRSPVCVCVHGSELPSVIFLLNFHLICKRKKRA